MPPRKRQKKSQTKKAQSTQSKPQVTRDEYSEALDLATIHPINNLPDELLGEVFTFRIHSSNKPISPVLLLLICRRWFNVAVATPALWTNIMFYRASPIQAARIYTQISDNAFKELSRRSVLCPTVHMLNRIIQRAGSLKFTLSLVDASSEDAGWSVCDFAPIRSRCRVIHFWCWTNVADHGDFTIGLGNMSALEELHFHPNATLPVKALSHVLLRAQSNSHQLTTLTLLLGPLFPKIRLSSLFKLLNRLKSLTCSDRIIIPMNVDNGGASEFMEHSSLTELDVDMDWLWKYPSLQIPQLRQLVVRAANLYMGLSPTPLSQYASVTTLSIHYSLSYLSEFEFWKRGNPVKLPELKQLLLDETWVFVQMVEAPKLETLILRGTPGRGMAKKEHFRRGLVRPRILYIDRVISEKLLVGLLREDWKDIEEFHLTMPRKGEAVGKTLMDGFFATTSSEPACPNLQRLYITHPMMDLESTDAEKQERAREETVKRLETIIKARKNDGILKHVSLGWYPATVKSIALDKWDFWNVEWSQLL